MLKFRIASMSHTANYIKLAKLRFRQTSFGFGKILASVHAYLFILYYYYNYEKNV